ncbi:CDGSH iron-sulfur domain-containing protein 2 homolog [Drosophila madeirensis]|uniref:CDGSH iron-sulfur domain-containing protein 2 homologue n=1 Tax=Drosophila madeirensis TaxID=30013 RepID=A0AAU9F8F4_DROMD
MEPISHLVKSTLPNYLSNLPIPDSIGGWFKLSFTDWLALIPPTVVVAGLGYTSYLAFFSDARCSDKKSGLCNSLIRKNEAKVVTMVDVEDIADKAAFCRCWKTKNWPYCDGSHAEHNKVTGDNVGPIVVKRN